MSKLNQPDASGLTLGSVLCLLGLFCIIIAITWGIGQLFKLIFPDLSQYRTGVSLTPIFFFICFLFLSAKWRDHVKP